MTNQTTKITKLFLDVEDVLEPLEQVDAKLVGQLRAKLTDSHKSKLLIMVDGDIEIEEIVRRTL